MSVDQTRVDEARERLRAADQNPFRNDPAIRVVELDSPRDGDEPLAVHPRVAVLDGLSESAKQSIAATVDGIRLRNRNVGLTGRVEVNGRRRPISSLDQTDRFVGSGLEAADLFISAPEANLYIEVAKSAERAIRLSAAELRGADERADLIDAQRAELAQSLAAASTLEPSADDRQAMLAMIDEVVLPVPAVQQLQRGVAALHADPQRVSLRAAIEQAEAARARLLPSDGNQAALLADLALAEADGSLAAYDVIPGGAASMLHGQLSQLGLDSTPDQAPVVAERVIAESIELHEMRHSLSRELGQGEVVEIADSIDDDKSLLDQRRALDEQRMRIQRRLRAQQQLLAIAQETIAELQGLGDSARAAGDLSPLLIEEPLADLPASLNGAVLSMLLRHSAHRQLICISNQRQLEQWSASVAGRAGWTRSQGWFQSRD